MLHLAFTTRYHLPLAKVNYILLASGCVTSFVSVFWQLLEISIDARRRAREWPFMFDYLEFVFPGATWSAVKSAAWLTLNALTVILSHVSVEARWCTPLQSISIRFLKNATTAD